MLYKQFSGFIGFERAKVVVSILFLCAWLAHKNGCCPKLPAVPGMYDEKYMQGLKHNIKVEGTRDMVLEFLSVL